jgi:hypothetical protein
VSFPQKICFKRQGFSLIEMKTAVDVHFRVQALQQVPTSTAGTRTEGKDCILDEYLGGFFPRASHRKPSVRPLIKKVNLLVFVATSSR